VELFPRHESQAAMSLTAKGFMLAQPSEVGLSTHFYVHHWAAWKRQGILRGSGLETPVTKSAELSAC